MKEKILIHCNPLIDPEEEKIIRDNLPDFEVDLEKDFTKGINRCSLDGERY